MRIVSILLLALLAGSLQGCFPVVAAGIGTGVLMAQDRRTNGAYIEDQGIENKSGSLVGKRYGDNVHINLTSYNRNVLITGEAPDEATKAEISKHVSGIENVRSVQNELVISGVSSLASRSSDALVTSNVKLRFLQNKVFNSDHVKVVTENGTVYLLGLAYRAEADAATEIASNTRGVMRVVRMFEYLD